MTNDEFLAEALSYERCPKNFENDYHYFCKYQKLSIDMLKEFVRVCDKNSIKYILSSGSVLGVVRDGGQIPWDYDEDVCVPFFERDRLYSALDKDLSNEYYYCAPERSSDYRPTIVRIVPKGYKHQVIHVDVFLLIGLPSEANEREEFCNEVRERVRARKYISQRLSDYPYPLKTKIHHLMLKCKYRLKFGKTVFEDNKDFYNRYDMRNSPYASAITANCGKRISSSKRFLEPVKYQCSTGSYYIPGDYEIYLQEKYGKWDQYLPIKTRIAEVEKHCELFRWYENHNNVPGGYDD